MLHTWQGGICRLLPRNWSLLTSSPCWRCGSQTGSTSSATMTLPSQRPLLNPFVDSPPPPLSNPIPPHRRPHPNSMSALEVPSPFSGASPHTVFLAFCATFHLGLPSAPPIVAGPFAQCFANPVTNAHPEPSRPCASHTIASTSDVPASEFGPHRLTRYLEMLLDLYVNVLTAMINHGRFSHTGHAVIRWEGQTAWGCG